MKKFIFFFVAAFLSITGAAYAHPPEDILLTFNPQTKILTAVVMHHTANPASHYIKKAEIKLNGEFVQALYFSRQENKVSQSFEFPIPNAKDKDMVSVEGYCSISGQLANGITVNVRPQS